MISKSVFHSKIKIFKSEKLKTMKIGVHIWIQNQGNALVRSNLYGTLFSSIAVQMSTAKLSTWYNALHHSPNPAAVAAMLRDRITTMAGIRVARGSSTEATSTETLCTWVQCLCLLRSLKVAVNDDYVFYDFMVSVYSLLVSCMFL